MNVHRHHRTHSAMKAEVAVLTAGFIGALILAYKLGKESG
jgi:hypothetical protein